GNGEPAVEDEKGHALDADLARLPVLRLDVRTRVGAAEKSLHVALVEPRADRDPGERFGGSQVPALEKESAQKSFHHGVLLPRIDGERAQAVRGERIGLARHLRKIERNADLHADRGDADVDLPRASILSPPAIACSCSRPATSPPCGTRWPRGSASRSISFPPTGAAASIRRRSRRS